MIYLTGAIFLVLLFVWLLYNQLITARARVDESWSGIDVQLKRRSTLIPNLVETVKSYAAHEKDVFESVTQARALLMQAKIRAEKSRADNMLHVAVDSLSQVAETYTGLSTP